MKVTGWRAWLPGAIASVIAIVLLVIQIAGMLRRGEDLTSLVIALAVVAVAVPLFIVWMVAQAEERRRRIALVMPEAHTLDFYASDELLAALPWNPLRVAGSRGTAVVARGQLRLYFGSSMKPAAVYDSESIDVSTGCTRSGFHQLRAVILTLPEQDSLLRLPLLPTKRSFTFRNATEAQVEREAAELREALDAVSAAG